MNNPRPQAETIRHTLLTAILTAQQRHQLFVPAVAGAPTTVVVGVSGGADSVALLHGLFQLRQTLRLDLHVAHLDHALRRESAQDAAFVAHVAHDWGLAFHHQRLPPNLLLGQSGGVEDAGRRARYTFFAQVARAITPAGQIPCVALAHHADDQAETVLLHLLRGSGLRGLGGMRWVQQLDLHTWLDDPAVVDVTLRVVRPLLQVRKQELATYLLAHQLSWREDRSNQEPQFARNQLRYEVLPLLATINPGIVETLGRTAATLAAESERVERLDQQTLLALCVDKEPFTTASPVDRVVLDLVDLRQLDQATQRGVLRQALDRLTPHLVDSTFEHMEQLLTGIAQPIRSRGPHPLYQGVAWSVAGPTPSRSAWLSLHRQGVLPFPPDHPYLAAEWQQRQREWSIAAGDPLRLADGWELHMTSLAPAELPTDWRRPDHPWRAYLAADQLANAMLAAPRPGLRFAPLGMAGQHKQLGDFFTDHKIPPTLRPGWPLLIDPHNNEVLWICGLAISQRVRITEGTERVVELIWQKQSGV